MVNRIILNETSYFGRGAINKIADELNSRGYKRVLLVTDKVLYDNKIAQKVIDVLSNNGTVLYIFMNIKPNPTIDNVKEGLVLAKTSNIDAIVAIGGGSVIDTSKAISIILTNPEYSDVASLEGVANTKNKGLPLIAIPTTAGTAAEVTINYVITNEEYNTKMVCVDPHDIPICSIIDPDLMQEMPQQLAATTGMDALTHAIEGYITQNAWLMTDMFHINAMALIYKNLEKAANEKDRDAIDNMAYAQYIAGMGFSNVGLGIVHSMAHALGAIFDTPHGLANAILLPHVLRFNSKACLDAFRNMANSFELDVSNMSDEEAAEEFISAITELSKKLGIPQSLTEIGIPYEAIPILAEKALADVCTPGNPIQVDINDIKNIYREAFH